MNRNARESLSALMDNEADELELRRILKSLDDSPADADAWRRYHLARSLMQRDRMVDVSTDLSAGIMARLHDEPLPEMERVSGKRSGAFSFAGSAAMAAAVSLMVITGVQVYNRGGGQEAPDVASQSADTSSQDAVQPVSSSAGGSRGQGASLASAGGGNSVQRPSLVDLPLFQSPSAGQGAMTVGAGADTPMFMVPNGQSQRDDQEQARLLQSYLDRHAEGASYRSGDAWMPLLRASGYETLGQR